MTFSTVQKIADAVLYEGYLLYPYHAGSDKNRVRFQFGVVAPQDFSLADGSEAWEMQTECLLDAAADATIEVRVRFLQLQARSVEVIDAGTEEGFTAVSTLEVAGERVVPWEEAVERNVDESDVLLAELCAAERTVPFSVAGARETEDVLGADGEPIGRIVRTRWPIEGLLRLGAQRIAGLVQLRVRVENTTVSGDEVATRAQALRQSLLGCHTLMAVRNGSFLSLINPPAEAADTAKSCTNLHTWPVLAGEQGSHDLLLSSPIILYDYPAIAPESQGDLFDSTEIDEILTLRIMTMSDEEKKAARATDPRARAIIDAADNMPAEMLDRLHGAIRYLRETPNHQIRQDVAVDPAVAIQPWSPDEPDWPTFREPKDDRVELPASVWQPEARVAPDRAAIEIGGIMISKGASVRLRPNRRADSMDAFMVGRIATVEAIYESVDDDTHVAVTIDDDPATDLHRASGRFFYFAPEELEPLAAAPSHGGPQPVFLEASSRSLADR